MNLIGEHTDHNEGWVLPFAIDRTAVVAAARREDGLLRMRSAQAGADAAAEVPVAALAPGCVGGWAAYVAGVAWALGVRGGADLAVDSTVPPGAGLASSAALSCAAGAALLGLEGRAVVPVELARAAQAAETAFAGVPVGIMDPLVAALGEAGHALLIDCRSLDCEALPFDPEASGLRLLVIDTKVRHALGDGAYAERREACAAAARALGLDSLRDARAEDLTRLGDPVLASRARHVLSENARVLAAAAALRRGALRELGPLLSASHASLRDSFEVSTPELDAVVSAAEGAGALGARMTGAGFGGSAIALVPAELEPAVRRAVGAARPEADVFAVAPAGGVRRLA